MRDLLGRLVDIAHRCHREFIEAQTSCVNVSLGYSEDALARAIIGPYLALADDTNPETRVPLVQ